MKLFEHYKSPLPKRGRRIHFIGIGGAGMCGIAEVMHHIGYAVSGSDLERSSTTQHLSSLGINVNIGHDAKYVYGCDVVVISTAVQANNPEVREARSLHIPVIPRAEMLGELMRFRQGIAIAGTHGKTTTTSLCTSLLAEGGLDPTFVIGGRLNSAGRHASLGAGEYLVAEADESDASFLHLNPVVAVITNIDADHMETYHNDFNELKQTFITFLQQLPFYGLAILCIDDPVIRDILPELTKPLLTYGFSEEANIRAINIQQSGEESHFNVLYEQHPWLNVSMKLPGRHNIQNALAAIAVAREVGVPDVAICQALSNFKGIDRRFQMKTLHIAQGDILLIDDYGHHPQEMAAVFRSIREGWQNRRLVVAFQPHRYSRTRDLMAEFADILSTVDVLLLLDIYSAGEAVIAGAEGKDLFQAIQALGHIEPIFVEKLELLPEKLSSVLKDQDILLTLGAGSIGLASAHLPNQLV